ncbi:hypothetical protein DSM106972_057880 [Dulcicalothrix desertica PCC 7102]|uniref:Uncharacterized protein n=1 Tax=Dulcicalothrix desertica PCC 7102 TaxID=232991 RepID=A0A3S1IV25_9CYAN|nr:hypothetical protein DSM106972_057880 [Dulcicalothrix desertica PCC 7102]
MYLIYLKSAVYQLGTCPRIHLNLTKQCRPYYTHNYEKAKQWSCERVVGAIISIYINRYN